MKKVIVLISFLCLIALFISVISITNMQKSKREIASYNSQFEYYNRDNLNGIDVTTVINKAIDLNEKNEIPKDEDGNYLNNQEDSIQVYLKLANDAENMYPMEKVNKVGIERFTRAFGSINFKCTSITYHKLTGKIESISFESTQK